VIELSKQKDFTAHTRPRSLGRAVRCLLLGIMALAPIKAQAAPGDLDTNFNGTGKVITFVRCCGIRCSGRGSAANSLVSYLLGITGVDPIRHKLLFERFLHTGRKGMPVSLHRWGKGCWPQES